MSTADFDKDGNYTKPERHKGTNMFAKLFEIGKEQILYVKDYDHDTDMHMINISVDSELAGAMVTTTVHYKEESKRDEIFNEVDQTKAGLMFDKVHALIKGN